MIFLKKDVWLKIVSFRQFNNIINFIINIIPMNFLNFLTSGANRNFSIYRSL